ncbi:hypothetical protein WN51_00238 [Melipona quadrifasciata]|uniref:Uncharacterized protein n=1 Tax=Melipona quadrifasciata TaxID=166423 RepID=A0A0M8ZZK5_9HYME|nr:hypothetical protein WN51_00238 [Melipona quadrifasciata]
MDSHTRLELCTTLWEQQRRPTPYRTHKVTCVRETCEEPTHCDYLSRCDRNIRWSSFPTMSLARMGFDCFEYFLELLSFRCEACFCRKLLSIAQLDRIRRLLYSISKRKQCDWQRCETVWAKRYFVIRDRFRHAQFLYFELELEEAIFDKFKSYLSKLSFID